ncbi:hypothetical protein NDU88_001895 [Pleurodeles waltl]|uniref:Uncharacterized protein n=1 Tax=Pleurodeles waltl TaxID=8319 RepID=A0AAV7W2E0_PLEWA|nr:hypothetical protein NDU88_001895 [Pleurodeles waltl]
MPTATCSDPTTPSSSAKPQTLPMERHDIRITADYSKDTNERRKAFLALRPRLRQLEMKYGLSTERECGSPKMEYPKTFMIPRT